MATLEYCSARYLPTYILHSAKVLRSKRKVMAPKKINTLKAACTFLCLAVLASNLWSMLRWNEARGVYDDICYLRQAHLLQRFGLGGFDTDVSRDDDGYLKSKLKEIG